MVKSLDLGDPQEGIRGSTCDVRIQPPVMLEQQGLNLWVYMGSLSVNTVQLAVLRTLPGQGSGLDWQQYQ